MAHPPISQLLLELVACILESLARGLNVVLKSQVRSRNTSLGVEGGAKTYNRYTGVPEAAVRLGIASIDLVFRIVLRAVIVSKLDETLSVENAVVVGQGVG